MVRKTELCVKDMPTEVEEFMLDIKLSDEEMNHLKEGYRPYDMDDKWCAYFENNKLYIHRSWTGICIYIIDFSDNNNIKATVNRNTEQYRETNIDRDRSQVESLLSWFSRR